MASPYLFIRVLCFRSCVLFSHHLSKTCHLVVIRQISVGGFLFLLPREFQPLGDRWRCLLRAHAIVRLICHESRLFPACMMSVVVASDDRFHFPPRQLVIERVPRYTDLAHEELEQFVDGIQFFTFSPSSCSSSVGFGSLSFSTSGMGKNSAASVITSL